MVRLHHPPNFGEKFLDDEHQHSRYLKTDLKSQLHCYFVRSLFDLCPDSGSLHYAACAKSSRRGRCTLRHFQSQPTGPCCLADCRSQRQEGFSKCSKRLHSIDEIDSKLRTSISPGSRERCRCRPGAGSPSCMTVLIVYYLPEPFGSIYHSPCFYADLYRNRSTGQPCPCNLYKTTAQPTDCRSPLHTPYLTLNYFTTHVTSL